MCHTKNKNKKRTKTNTQIWDKNIRNIQQQQQRIQLAAQQHHPHQLQSLIPPSFEMIMTFLIHVH
jgi:hypothetical protein